jgi:hypothetical protein
MFRRWFWKQRSATASLICSMVVRKNALFFAVNILVNTESGDTYSFEEISSWLKAAGFTDARKLDAPGPSPLILATKP